MREKIKIGLKELAIKILTLDYFVIKKIIKRQFLIKNAEKVLDIGCGTGILSTLFPKSSYRGIDIDQKLIQYAREKYKNNFFCMNIDNLKFPKNTFEKIIIVGVVHHLDERVAKKAFDEIKKVLKKEGRILLIEAIPPISKYNIFGQILRFHDKGKFVRTMNGYIGLFKDELEIIKQYKLRGGIFDYGVFVLKKTTKLKLGK